jgi:catechol 2,3-dioxygenase-like lactoylglutathione lyase family enzyme
MSIRLDHTIVWCRDNHRASHYVCDVLGRPEPKSFGPFLVVTLDNGASLDFLDTREVIAPQHYAFLVAEEEFDQIMRRIQARRIDYWADPEEKRPGEINHNDGGRGVYFNGPDGHQLEVITRPYGFSAG